MFARPLDLSQLEEALKARDMQRPEFLYLRNRLIAELGRVREENSLAPMGNFYGVFDPSGLRHVAFFSVGRSLVSGPGVANDADALLSICLHEEHGFRILIGPPAIVRVLVDNIASRVQIEMDRSQPFMAVEQGEELGETCEMRVAQRKDLSWLIDCSLALNLEDLKVEPELVNRRVLRKRLLARVKEGKTDPDVCRIVWKTPFFADYNFTAHPDLEQLFGEGFTAKLQRALIDMKDTTLLSAFPRSGLIPATNEDFEEIAHIAKQLDMVR